MKLPELSSADLHRKLLDKYQVSVDEMFRSPRAETLPIDSVKPSVVFDAYARKIGLFGDDAKKDQFPDAFIFEVLKAGATKRDPLTIISDDKDFTAAIKDAEHITWLKSIADLFAELGLTIEAAPDVEDFVENNLDQIVAIVHNELNQWSLQVSDVDDGEIEDSTVEHVRFVDFRTFRTAGARKDILVVGRIEMDVKVSYHHPDWDTATYDSEDKLLLPHHTVEGDSTANRPRLRSSRSTTTTSSGYRSDPTNSTTNRSARDQMMIRRRPTSATPPLALRAAAPAGAFGAGGRRRCGAGWDCGERSFANRADCCHGCCQAGVFAFLGVGGFALITLILFGSPGTVIARTTNTLSHYSGIRPRLPECANATGSGPRHCDWSAGASRR